MVQEKGMNRLRLLGLVGDGDNVLQSVIDKHGILLGKLINEVGLGNILYGIESPDTDVSTHAAIATAHHVKYTDANARDAIAAANLYLRQDGTKPLTANWPVGSKKLTGLAAGSGAGDSVRYEQLHAQNHKTRHHSGGGDAVQLDNLAAPDDNTDLDATTAKHGLLKKLGGGTSNFLRADGAWASPPGGGGLKVSKSYMFEFPDEDMAVGDFIPENAIRIPASGKHGDITWGTVYVRCEVVGTGTNTILFRTSTTLTGGRTTRATVNLSTSREASASITLTESDGMYLWVECSAVGGTAPTKVTAQVDAEEAVY